ESSSSEGLGEMEGSRSGIPAFAGMTVWADGIHSVPRSALGLEPVQRLNAREKAAGSEKPSR
ncbi:MAG: hypothetical protein JWP15_2245, partial [Alphaproteobacteria bacterium]|nr:hypothetical protein [Alphaproteobacteria bacterium]